MKTPNLSEAFEQFAGQNPPRISLKKKPNSQNVNKENYSGKKGKYDPEKWNGQTLKTQIPL